MREPIGGRGGLRLEPSAIVNRLTHELLYNWTNGRIWFALLLFWAVLIEVRLLAATNDEFQDASLRRVASYASPRYLYFDLCGDSGDKLMSLLDGIAFAYEVNVTAVIPSAPSKEEGDDAWLIDDLIDMEHLIHQLAPNVTIVRVAPIVGSHGGFHGSKLDMLQIPPRQRAGLLRETFDLQATVHIGCPRWTFQWTMSYHSTLRRTAIQSFRPPKQMETVMALSNPVRASSFSCLLERTEDSWLHFCKSSEQRTDNLRVMSWRECFLSHKRILDYVSHSGLSSASTLYLRGTNESLVAQLRHMSLKTYTSSALARSATERVPRDMLDFYVCLSANMTAVNSYSSLGFLLKEARYLQGNPHTEYYNQEATFCSKILCKEEQRRWQLDASLYSTGEDQRRTWVSELHTNGLMLSGLLRVAKSCRFNFGVGWSCKTTQFTFTCSVDGKVHYPIPATLAERPMSGDYEFTWRLPFSRPGRYVAHVWAHSETATFEMDGSPLAFDVPGMNFYLYGVDASRHSMRSLYLLHDELLQHFDNMSYIYPTAAGLRSTISRPLEVFMEEQLSARDVLIIGDMDAPQDMVDRLQHRGVKVVRWIIEQQMNAVDELHNTGGVLPVCSSHHFMEQYACPPKAWIGRPLSPRAVESSKKGTVCNKGVPACPKRNLILIDHDTREQAATGISLEQLQAALGSTELLSFTDFGLDDLTELYKRARLTLDLFVSGREPVLFEAALFNACPLVAYHGSARDSLDFPLPRSLLLDIENLTETAIQINAALSNCTSKDLTAVKAEALAMNERFPLQVSRFFSDNVLFYIVCRTQEDEDWAVPTMLALLLNYPFADIELVVRSEHYFRYDNAVLFELLGRKSFAKSITVTQRQTTNRNHRLEDDMFLVNRPDAKHLTTWIYQWPPGDIALSSELVAENVLLYEEALETTDRITAIIQRSRTDRFVRSSRSQFFIQQDLHFDVLALHEAQSAEQLATAKEETNGEKEKEKALDPKELAELRVRQAAEGKWKGMTAKERELTRKPLGLVEMSAAQAAEEIGVLLLQEPATGTWRVGGEVTAGMCDQFRGLQRHELWRSGAAFLSDEVSNALTQLSDACSENHKVEKRRVEERQIPEHNVAVDARDDVVMDVPERDSVAIAIAERPADVDVTAEAPKPKHRSTSAPERQKRGTAPTVAANRDHSDNNNNV